MMPAQQLTVFLNPETHEELMRMRRESGFHEDDDLIRAALGALRREWQTGHERYLFGSDTTRPPVMTDEDAIHHANMSPDDFGEI